MIVSYSRALLMLFAIGLGLTSSSDGSVFAQEFPTRPLRIVVPFPPGSGVDSTARLIGQTLSKEWSQPVVIENHAGAGGNAGAEFVAKSPPDGYTLLISASGVFSSNKLLYRNLTFDLEKDLKPVSLLSVMPNVLAVAAKGNVAASNLRELIAYARAHPGGVLYASQGNGSSGHLTGAYLAQSANINIVHVPYRGSAPAWQDVLGGHVTMMWDGLATILGQIRGGSLRPLAIASRERSPLLPEVPTAIESGLAGFESNTWFGAAVASGTPDALVRLLSDAVSRAIRGPDMSMLLTGQGARVIGSSPEELAAHIEIDTARWKKVVEAGNIRVD